MGYDNRTLSREAVRFHSSDDTLELATDSTDSVLRYRLYDFDILINLMIVYVTLTAIVALIFHGKYGAARTRAAFGATLRNELDLSELHEYLPAVVHGACFSMFVPTRTIRETAGLLDRTSSCSFPRTMKGGKCYASLICGNQATTILFSAVRSFTKM
jgi:hypothetical protein